MILNFSNRKRQPLGDHVVVLDHVQKLVKVELAISVQVTFHNSLVNELLQLLVTQILADHHLENDIQLAIRDEPVVIDIIYLEGD